MTKQTAKTPTTRELLPILVGLHGTVRQIQYAYSSKIAKYSVIGEAELDAALPGATEVDIWRGQKPSEVSLKIAGPLRNYLLESGDALENLQRRGLSEGSLKTFLEMYCRLKPDGSAAIGSTEYYRDAEMDNLQTLTRIFDEEIFDHPDMNGTRALSNCIKSKWWKECHRVCRESVANEIYHGLKLGSRPQDWPCYTPRWTNELTAKIRQIAIQWRQSPLWDQSTSDVDFTTNNERTVKEYLKTFGFDSFYLEGRRNP